MKRLASFFFLSCFFTMLFVSVRSAEDPKRPRILGVAHMALFVSDLQKSRLFYEDFLGYAEPYA